MRRQAMALVVLWLAPACSAELARNTDGAAASGGDGGVVNRSADAAAAEMGGRSAATDGTVAIDGSAPDVGPLVTPGARYFVDPAKGADGNSGTRTSPFKTIKKALAKASPGDEVRLLPGRYSGPITISRSGKPEKPIILTADQTAAGKRAVIDGGWKGSIPSKGDRKYGLVLDGVSWLVIQNLRFEKCWNKAIILEDTSYVTVRGCDFVSASIPVQASAKTHHTLIENSHWKPAGQDYWKKWTWSQIKTGKYDFLAQSTIYGGKSLGAAIIRDSHLEYAFNTFRNEYCVNIEVYGNRMDHIRDNAIEPEEYIYNFHVHHNRIDQLDRGMFSIDSDKGGPMYAFGNVGRYDPSDYSYDKMAGRIFKLVTTRKRYLDKPFYFFNNSWYHYKLSFKPNRFQKNIKHYNNAYQLNQGVGFGGGWDSWLKGDGNEFDYDSTVHSWPSDLTRYGHEKHGLEKTKPGFRAPEKNDYRLATNSPLIDKGKLLPDLVAHYRGKAPDIGAFEGGEPMIGPAFEIAQPPGGLGFKERPRVTQHRVTGSTLVLHFSWPLAGTVAPSDITLRANGHPVTVTSAKLDKRKYELTLATNASTLEKAVLQLRFDKLPKGTNGQPATHWGSTIRAR